MYNILCHYTTEITCTHIKSIFAISEHNTPMIHTSVLKTLHNHQTLNAYTEILSALTRVIFSYDKPGKRNMRKINGERERKREGKIVRDGKTGKRYRHRERERTKLPPAILDVA